MDGTMVSKLVAGNTEFALNLYQVLAAKEGGNLFLSPYSISVALAMTYAGARGETERQMAEVLRLPPQDQAHPAMAALIAAMESRAHGAGTKEDGGVSLSIANSLWGQEDYKFLPEFLGLLSRHYGAGLRRANFAGDPQGAAEAVNGWVAEQTRGMIRKVLSAGNIPPLTKLILANAVYFNAAWKYKFDVALTAPGRFYLPGGEVVTVPMMAWKNAARLGYGRGPDYEAVELPYDGGELSMLILLPDRRTSFAEFEASLDADRLAGIVSALCERDVQMVMPKFGLTWGAPLKRTLSALGMGIAFSNAANFSGMDGRRYLTIDEVIHKARIDVDEDGTRAAAVTVVIARGKSVGGPVYLRIDRPFVFLIRDRRTGTVLFMGRVINPA